MERCHHACIFYAKKRKHPGLAVRMNIWQTMPEETAFLIIQIIHIVIEKFQYMFYAYFNLHVAAL